MGGHARRTETLLLFGFPRRVKVTDVTKTARRFLRKKENTEKRENTERQEEERREETKTRI